MFKRVALALAFGVLSTSMAQAATVTITIGAPGEQAVSSTFNATGLVVEDFDSAPQGGLSNYAGAIGTYSSGTVSNANRFGGADESAFITTGSPTTLSLTNSATYFGFWWSAGNAGNTLSFFSGATEIFAFDTNDVVDFLNNNASNASAYYGNPNPGFAGQNGGEAYAYINFFSDTSFDAIQFTGGGFESDNHTVATSYSNTPGVDISPVPVPASLPLLGGAMIGMVAWSRRRRRAAA
ncbi:MAG: PEP-CTERM sorting domain-containing protein [Pseudomonadota bacterium]